MSDDWIEKLATVSSTLREFYITSSGLSRILKFINSPCFTWFSFPKTRSWLFTLYTFTPNICAKEAIKHCVTVYCKSCNKRPSSFKHLPPANAPPKIRKNLWTPPSFKCFPPSVISYENLQLQVKYRLLLYSFTSFAVVLYKKYTSAKFLFR